MYHKWKKGTKVLFIDGRHQGKFGKYLYHDRDSGYLVPFVDIGEGDQFPARPWDKEIVVMADMTKDRDKAQKQLDEVTALLELWADLEQDEQTSKE